MERPAIADSTGERLTFGRALTGATLLARTIDRRAPAEPAIGVLLPASVGGALVNIAAQFAGKIVINLNFTAGAAGMQLAIADAGVRTVITSRRFLTKAGVAELPGMVFVEDLLKQTSAATRVLALATARFTPAWLLRKRYRGHQRTTHSTAAVIFSSGSTGVPKGVLLSHANILSNIDSLAQIYPIGRADCCIGVLPLFHSFGFMGTLWFPLLQAASVAYHPNPMDAKAIGDLAERHRATLLISTPTFCAAYVRRCTKEQFAHLRYAIVGAEKLREPLAAAFRANSVCRSSKAMAARRCHRSSR